MHDHTPDEVESRAELERHLATGTLAQLTVQGLRLDSDPPVKLEDVDVTGALFLGCRFDSPETAADLVRRGAHLVADFVEVPYSTHPAGLYRAEDLTAGFAEGGFAGMYDSVVYRHFVEHGGPLPAIREALTQRLHDHGIDNALGDALALWGRGAGTPDAWTHDARDAPVNGLPGGRSVVGIMGGHAEPRGSAGYRSAAAIGQGLAAAGCLVVTGGGPGVMEAANLGAYLVDAGPVELNAAITALSAAPDFRDHDPYTQLALDLLGAYPSADLWRGGLAVPTWLYGHEPANLFAGRIAKYFSNAIREDTILRLARGGIIFAEGRAGTVQEIFQAATKTFYATDGPSGPFVFLGRAFWTEVLPVTMLLRPLLAASPYGDLAHLIVVTDDPAEAIGAVAG